LEKDLEPLHITAINDIEKMIYFTAFFARFLNERYRLILRETATFEE
jgi:hypothetical protein